MKRIIALILVFGLLYYTTYYTDRFDLFSVFRTQYEYKSEFAILNKSFKRDVKRSANLYQSFEKYYVGAEKTPFYIVIPNRDLELFQNAFNTLKEQNKIQQIPIFMTEEEVLAMCDEPSGILYNENWTQQVIKLCFGMTNLAKNYFAIDSDAYFTRTFDAQYKFFKNDILRVMSYQLRTDDLEASKKQILNWFGVPNKPGLSHTAYQHMTKIKHFFDDHKVSKYYGFVYGGVLISSDAIHRMRDFMENKGGYNFASLIRISPFEMQWYGEYMLQHEKFFSSKTIVFSLINSPDECRSEKPKHSYGYVFQSVIYDYKTHKPAIENMEFIYKRPAHCGPDKFID